MITEAYCSFEVAKLMNEKGFEGVCDWYYPKNGGEIEMLDLYELNYCRESFISAPTQQMAMAWLREEHKIHITTEPLEMFKQEKIVYEPIIYLLNDFDDFALEYKTVHLKECDTNEDAIEVALEYALTKLI